MNNLRAPALALMLCTKFINKIDSTSIELMPRTINDIIVDGNYLRLTNDALSDEPFNDSVENVSFSQHYPCVAPTKRRAISRLSDKDYIEVLRIALHAHMRVYHLADIMEKGRALADQSISETNDGAPNKCVDQCIGPDKLLKRGERAGPHASNDGAALDGEDLSLVAAVDSIYMAQRNCVLPFDAINKKSKIQLFDGIRLECNAGDLLRCRDDIKYIDIIKKNIHAAANTHFGNWLESI